MRLIARIKTRKRDLMHFVVPSTVRPWHAYITLERVVKRNIGPRPWAEMTFVEKGETHLVYAK